MNRKNKLLSLITKFDIKKFFTNRPIAKILSVVGAILLSFYVIYQEEDVQELPIIVEVKNIPDHLAVSSRDVRSVKVRLTGKRSVLSGIESEQISAYVDLSSANKGEGEYEIFLDAALPQGVKARLSETRIHVTLDTFTTKWIKVEAVLDGAPPPGHKYMDYDVVPKKVEVSGAESLLDSINSIKTETIDIRKIIKTTVRYVNLMSVENTEYGEHQVAVTVKVVPERDTREFENLLAAAINLDEKRFSIENPFSLRVRKIIVKGPKSKILDLDAPNISITLDLKDIKTPGVYTNLKAKVELPSDIEVVEVVPKTFEIKITEIR